MLAPIPRRGSIPAKGTEIVVLPGSERSVIGDDVLLGPHTVVISGFVDVPFLFAPSDDDVCRTQEVFVDIEDVLWEPEFIQATTMTSWGEIRSSDSDEVDHSTWGIRKVQTGHTDFLSGTIVRKLRLLLDVVVQGDGNSWQRIGFQIVANGTLKDVLLPTTLASVNETQEILTRFEREH